MYPMYDFMMIIIIIICLIIITHLYSVIQLEKEMS